MKNREIEVRILEIDVKKTILKLKSLGAKKDGDYIYNRIIYDFPDNSLDKEDSWIRLRTDGGKTTLAYKKEHNKKVDGMEEHEVAVSDFEKTREILKTIGLEEKRISESRRIRFSLDNAEIDIDFRPLLPAYMEVEAKTKKELIKTLKKLGINQNNSKLFTGRGLYAHYGLDKKRALKLEKNRKEMKI